MIPFVGAKMDPTDSLLHHGRPSTAVGDKSFNKGETNGVMCDVVNECSKLLKAEDGGGDAKLLDTMDKDHNEKPKFPITSTPYEKRDSTSDQIADSHPECDIEGVPELPLDDGGLPSTVTVLDAPNGGKVYVVGTAHFSIQSQEDVSRVIREVSPHIVMVELCEQRTNILLLDEELLLREAKNINIKKIRAAVAESGVMNGLMYILLLNMSADITRKLGMAPGGEFRRALQEARKIPNCKIHLGDRAIDVTVRRAISSLSWRQFLRFLWYMLTSDQNISVEEVEKCKQKKMLDEMLEEMAEEFPPLKRVFVVERDMYLCYSLQIAALQNFGEPCRVVGVVGMGHVAGIAEHWGKVAEHDIPPLMTIPPASWSTRVLRASGRVALAAAVVYVGYRLFPRRWLP